MTEPTAAPVADSPTPSPAPAPSPKKALPLAKLGAIALALAAVGGLTVLASRLMPSGAGQAIVVVDVSRIVQAERAILDRDPEGHRLTIMRAGKVAEDVIQQIAGPKTIVLVRQAVVGVEKSGLRDITDDVLTELGLPTDVVATMKVEPLTSHGYTAQGRQILEAEREKTHATDAEGVERQRERDKKETLLP